MFGFDGSIKAIVHFLEQIKDNKEGEKLTHREVRAYGRLMLALVPDLSVDRPEEIKLLLAAMSTSGLPHYDRSFAAGQILKLLEKQEERRGNSSDADYF
ncbi:MAG: hypothetical protein V7K57_21950 [Nostoc sp.]|uniref:hypothetical protein n=1 Tax=Nostoc sp. TaxID=1180 RepID=UPI002FF629B3